MPVTSDDLPARPRVPVRRSSVLASLAALAMFACAGKSATAPAPAEPPVAAVEEDTSAAASPEPAPAPTPEPSPVEPAEPAPADPLAPLDDRQRALFLAGEPDTLSPTPIHYVKSNEIRHDVWFPYIRELGGVYIGVGSDQNYTLIATARAQLVFLLDIDINVVRLHRVYEALIEASEDPETLLQRWHEDSREESVALLEQAFADLDEEDRKRLIRQYKASRETVYRHLRIVIRRTRGGQATSWLSNPDLYAHIRTLYQRDRVRMMGGDLTGSSALKAAGDAAKALELPVKVLYLSNAEEYFKYVETYRENVRNLPVEDDSVVLRTIYSKEWVHADNLWGYQVQRLTDFQARLTDLSYRSRNTLFRLAEKEGVLDRETGVKGLSLIGAGLERPDADDKQE